MELTATRHSPDDPALAEVLGLIRESFAYMEGRIDPPSSMHRMTLASLREDAQQAEVWSLGPPLSACMVLTPKPHALYIGKLSVAGYARRKGLATRLVTLAEERAKALGLPALELQSRVELTENHATFIALGFSETGRTSHTGFDRPTSITFRRTL